ncbi:ATP-binding protein [Noviherbaspirillum sp. 1P10PC]|uniref:ATP-binding protein n=1 Tax=Noviherbaspirillum sp. 1P10PC TaxID=3132292 RepID=UPI0039A02B7B
MTKYISIPATYRSTGVRRFDGNPFIEALPPLETSKDAILDRLKNYPPVPTTADLKKSELVRSAEVGCINEIVYPFAEYKRAGTNLTMNIRESYVARNPLSVQDVQRRHAIALNQSDVLFPSNWVSTAKGQTLLGISGSGKTTFATAFSLPYQVVIEHTEYQGKPLICRQIPWVNIRMSHDATLKSLCLQFFEVVDHILGNTNYRRQAESVRIVARMVMLIAQVATAVSVGVIFIDEIQNLKAAIGKNAVFVLNLFSEIIEKAGVTLVVAGTPALGSVIDENVRNLRKLNSGGESTLAQMKYGDPEFNAFCDTYWEYQYVKKPVALNTKIREAWHNCGAGNPAFTALSFMLAQRNEIGGREVIDAAAFDRVSKIDMAILEPAIAALRSGKGSELKKFDDLLFKEGCTSLRKLIAWSDGGETPSQNNDEFSELQETSAVVRRKGKNNSSESQKRLVKGATIALPTEDPLIE